MFKSYTVKKMFKSGRTYRMTGCHSGFTSEKNTATHGSGMLRAAFFDGYALLRVDNFFVNNQAWMNEGEYMFLRISG